MTPNPAPPNRDPGTPIYDQVARASPDSPPDPDGRAGTAVPDQRAGNDLIPPVTVLDLFGRMKALEESDGGWPGSDVVDALNRWFSEFGVDVDADEAVAAKSLKVPAWLARLVTTPMVDEAALALYIRTEHPEPLERIRPYLASLIWELGSDTTVAVYDGYRDQIAHLVHPEFAAEL
ncbi:MAG TPA: hypothetical protein VFG15_03045 [Amycolatopsis sp.]|nr:hypothetical protein [Amycolatopsis sp.]